MSLTFHRELIRKHGTILIDKTDYSVRLITRCTEENIITRDNANRIRNERDLYVQKQLLYNLVELMDFNTFNKLIQIMKEDGINQSNDLIDILTGKYGLELGSFIQSTNNLSTSTNIATQLPIWFNVPIRNDSFQGRIYELDLLHNKIIRNVGNESKVSVLSQLTSISGLGGIGKTSLAIKYAWDKGDFFDGNVIWIDSINNISMEESFKDLAIKIGHTVQYEKDLTRNSINHIYTYFSCCKSLFIFDNVNEYFGGVEKYLPRSLPRNATTPFILMTSRKRKLVHKAELVELGVLKPWDAHTFIQKELKIPEDEDIELVHQLASKLQYLPLALKQAVAYIRMKLNIKLEIFGNNENSIQKYLNKFEDKTIKLLGFEYYNNETDDIYKKTVLTTWLITMDDIVKEKQVGVIANEILNLLGYFNSHVIKTTTFHNIYTKKNAENGILMLMNYSMIDIKKDECKTDGSSDGFEVKLVKTLPYLINIHSLVQTVVREQNKHRKDETLTILNNIDTFKPLCYDGQSDEDGQNGINLITEQMNQIVVPMFNE